MNQQKAFTLIELLVVVSIITLLSSVILAALSQAMVNARNARANQLAIQYFNALELYRTQYNVYPLAPAQTACLGTGYTNNNCGYFSAPNWSAKDNSTDSTALQTALAPFIGSQPALNTNIVTCGISICVGGYYYSASSQSKSITWFLEGQRTRCARPPNAVSFTEDSTTYSGVIMCNIGLSS